MRGGRTLVATAAVLLVGCGGGAASSGPRPTYGSLIIPGGMPSIANPPAVLDTDAPPDAPGGNPTATAPESAPSTATDPSPTAAPTTTPSSTGRTLTPPSPTAPSTTSSATTPSATSTSVAGTNPLIPAVPVPNPVGRRVAGNSILAIGDSILASVSARYTDDLCTALMPLGWDLEIEAETGRFVTFGADVLKKLLEEPTPPIVRQPNPLVAGTEAHTDAEQTVSSDGASGGTAPEAVVGSAAPGRPVDGSTVATGSQASTRWDVVLIQLGSNYRGDPEEFRSELAALIGSVAPAHVVLSTVSEFEDSRIEVNDIIRQVGASFGDRVTLFNWAESSAYFANYLGGDNLHLTNDGRVGYADLLANLFGQAPVGGVVGCRDAVFTDDSAGPVTPGKARTRTTTRAIQPPKVTKPSSKPTTKPTTKPTSKPTNPPTTTAPPATSPPSPGS